jgi:hypothetical protein
MKKIFPTVVLVAMSSSVLLASGCAESANRPDSPMAESSLTPDQQRWVSQHSIDQKGHFNPVLHQQALNQMRSAH